MATPVKRKLAAILAAGAVGYSRHMAADEEGTLKLLAAHRAVIDGIIEFHEGRIVNTAGDSVLAEFGSPVQAVRCAVEIQDALRTRNDSLPEAQRLQFRIGVNLGDVMVKGDDLLGDGVNVAARLESVAEPGGICISSSVYDQISGKLDLGFVDVGAQSLKNIDRPVRVYRIERAGGGRARTTRRRSPAAKWIAGLALLAAAGAGAWHFVVAPMQEAERQAKAAAAAKAADEARAREEVLAKARADAEAAKQRAEVEAEKARAEAEAARRRAETEAAKQRAVAEAARRRADEQAAAAAEAKRALEAQRSAEARKRAEAELARLRAEAEEAKRKAAAELAAAEEARRAAEAAARAPAAAASAATLSLRDGRWSAEISCPPFRDFPGRVINSSVSVSGDAFTIEEGISGWPGSLSLRGVQNADGSVVFNGTGITGRRGGAREYRAGFSARPVGTRYEGSGRLGGRECTIVLSRAP